MVRSADCKAFSGKFAEPLRSLILYLPWKIVTRKLPSSTSSIYRPSTPASLPPSVNSGMQSSSGRSRAVDMHRTTNAADLRLFSSGHGNHSGWASTMPVTRRSTMLALMFVVLLHCGRVRGRKAPSGRQDSTTGTADRHLRCGRGHGHFTLSGGLPGPSPLPVGEGLPLPAACIVPAAETHL